MSISVLATSKRREFLPERFEPRLAILGTKDDVKDDLAERLRHAAMMARKAARSESRFQR
jgi:hypothetical protein